MNKMNIICVCVLILLNFQTTMPMKLQDTSISKSQGLFGINPYSGLKEQYGCHKSKCWAYCSGLDKMWCWTNKKSTDGQKSCSSDKDCDSYFYKCVSACGL